MYGLAVYNLLGCTQQGGIIMKRFLFCLVLSLALIGIFWIPAQAGMEDRFSKIELRADNWAEFPEIAAPSGNPTTNYGWLYLKDNGGISALYFENDSGYVTLFPSFNGGTFIGTTLGTNAEGTANSITGESNNLVFEGATADDYETRITVTDPTADRTLTIPNETAAAVVSSLTTNATDAANSITGASNSLIFEGATADAYETNIVATDPTADRTITLPNSSITAAELGTLTGLTSSTAELNIMDGVLATTVEINTIADGILATAAEVNTVCDGVLTGSGTVDVASIAADANGSLTITVTGAALGDFAIFSAGVDLVGLIATCYVSAANTVTVNLENQTAAAIDLASTTWKAKVLK